MIESRSKIPVRILRAALCATLALPAFLALSSCESLRMYEGAKRDPRDVAVIAGDTRFSGAPVSIVLRRVDRMELGMRYRGVEVLPGAYTLLIDCTVTESKRTSRHHLDVEVDAGVKYRLVANTGRGNRECVDVQLVSVN